jgi:hypothetical protein
MQSSYARPWAAIGLVIAGALTGTIVGIRIYPTIAREPYIISVGGSGYVIASRGRPEYYCHEHWCYEVDYR